MKTYRNDCVGSCSSLFLFSEEFWVHNVKANPIHIHAMIASLGPCSYTQLPNQCIISYYKSSSVCLFVCLSVCLFVPYLLRGPLTDLRQTWWVYVGGPRNCPWGVLFRKGQRRDGSTGHFHFPLYYICASLTPHSCKRRLCCYCN